MNYPPVQSHSVGSPLTSVRERYSVYSQEPVDCLLRTEPDAACAMMTLNSRITGFETKLVQTDSGTFANQEQYATWSDNKVRELIAVKVLHTSLLNTTVVAFKVHPLRSYAPMTAPSPPFKTILELVLWNGLQSCRCITPDVINVIKIPSFQYFLYLMEHKKVIGG